MNTIPNFLPEKFWNEFLENNTEIVQNNFKKIISGQPELADYLKIYPGEALSAREFSVIVVFSSIIQKAFYSYYHCEIPIHTNELMETHIEISKLHTYALKEDFKGIKFLLDVFIENFYQPKLLGFLINKIFELENPEETEEQLSFDCSNLFFYSIIIIQAFHKSYAEVLERRMEKEAG